jgi:cytochrome c oxidase subunit 2
MVFYNLLYLALVAVGVVIFGVIFLSTRRKAREKRLDVATWKRRENAWLAVVGVGLTVVVLATVFKVPWRAEAKPDRQIVHVNAQQFGFTFDNDRYTVGRQVEFVLTATDVNHAFAVYDPDGTFVAQAQMMPKWEQRLRVTFHKPGTYAVRCFEYCGLGHHRMVASFRVEEAG